MRAFRIVRDKIPWAELWVIGDGAFRKDLESAAVDGVRFFGGLCDGERRRLLRRAWVLVNPSVREGWGLNVVEAAALGVPCVAYDVAGLRDSVRDGFTGLLTENGNTEALAAQVMHVLQSDPLRHELAGNALKCAKEFNWNKTAKQFMNVLKASVNEL